MKITERIKVALFFLVLLSSFLEFAKAQKEDRQIFPAQRIKKTNAKTLVAQTGAVLSDKAIYFRCFKILVGARPEKTDFIVEKIEKGQIDGSKACAELLDRISLLDGGFIVDPKVDPIPSMAIENLQRKFKSDFSATAKDSGFGTRDDSRSILNDQAVPILFQIDALLNKKQKVNNLLLSNEIPWAFRDGGLVGMPKPGDLNKEKYETIEFSFLKRADPNIIKSLERTNLLQINALVEKNCKSLANNPLPISLPLNDKIISQLSDLGLGSIRRLNNARNAGLLNRIQDIGGIKSEGASPVRGNINYTGLLDPRQENTNANKKTINCNYLNSNNQPHTYVELTKEHLRRIAEVANHIMTLNALDSNIYTVDILDPRYSATWDPYLIQTDNNIPFFERSELVRWKSGLDFDPVQTGRIKQIVFSGRPQARLNIADVALENFFPKLRNGEMSLRMRKVSEELPDIDVDLRNSFGGGILGSREYFSANHGQPDNMVSTGVLNIPRRWAKNIFNDLLCRELPVLRTSDVEEYLAKSEAAEGFRKGTSCLGCHATIDPMSYTARNLRWLRNLSSPDPIATDFPGVRGVSRNHIGIINFLHQTVPTIRENEFNWYEQEDNDFSSKDPVGLVHYRNYKGELIKKKVQGISQMAAVLAEQDDFYVCQAKRAFNHLTGYDVKIYDIGAESEEDKNLAMSKRDWELRSYIVSLGLDLKRHQSLAELYKKIMDSEFFKSRDYLSFQLSE